MLRQLHHLLITNRLTRPMQRRATVSLKRLLGCPDPFATLAAAYRRSAAVAVLDIGSHEGATVSKCLDFIPDARVHAFEPTPQTAAILRGNLKKHPNVVVHELAIADRSGTMKFFCNAGTMQNSLLDNAADVNHPFPDLHRHLAEVEVPTMSLDDWAAKHEPSGNLIIKADVQGAEAQLVAGGRQTLLARVAAFYSEVCLLPQYEGQADFFQLHRTLTEELGFVLYDIYPCGKDASGRAAWTDAMWIKPQFLPLE